MSDIAEITNGYDRIRTILGVDELDLSNEVIDYPEYFSCAERSIKSKVSNWAELDEDKKSIFESCVLYKTAELLLPYCKATANNVKVEQTTHSKVEYFETSIGDKYSSIKDTIGELLSQITDNISSFYGFDIS